MSAVAVVIPFYNGSAFIERAARSVAEQSVPADEFVVVNDGSQPSEREALNSLAPRYGFRVIDQLNGGQGSARNAGVLATRSPYICFLDQDDFFLKNHIKILTSNIPADDPEFGWVYGDAWHADGDGHVLRSRIVAESADHPKTNILRMLGQDMYVVPSMSLISRQAFESVGGFDPQFRGYEDDDLFLRMYRKGFTNFFVPQAVTAWCIRPDSTSGSILMSRSRLRFFKKLAAMFPDVRGIYYLRDLLIPRFHSHFLREAINSISPGDHLHAHADELLEILSEYAGVVSENRHVSRSFKRRLAMKVWLLKTNSKSAIRTAQVTITKLRAIRAMAYGR
ncbi:MAG: glycosyltransferase family A protein [Pseudorhodoplanes sp.]